MINRKFLTRLIAASAITAFVFSCKPDPKEEPTPTDPKQRFIGSWSCAEHSVTDGSNSNYVVHIVDSTADNVLIESFYGLGFNKKAKAKISGDNINITIPQSVNGYSIIRSTGHLDNSSTITMMYVVNAGSGNDSCTATLTKQ